MELKNLATFAKIVELNSFSKAASALGYTQSTVSIQIRELERELNVRLFDRINKKIYLTATGQEILKYAHEVICNTNKIKNYSLDYKNPTGKIRFGTLFSIYVPLIRPLLIDYHHRYPHVEIMVKLGVTKELMAMLNNNYVDFILTMDERYSTVHWTNAGERIDEAVFLCSSNDSLANAKDVDIETLLNKDWILTRQGCNYRYQLDEQLNAHNLEPHPILEIDDMPTILDFVAHQNAISLLPYITAKSYIERGLISKFTIKNIQIKMWTQLFYHQTKWLTPACQLFMQDIQKLLFPK